MVKFEGQPTFVQFENGDVECDFFGARRFLKPFTGEGAGATCAWKVVNFECPMKDCQMGRIARWDGVNFESPNSLGSSGIH